MLKIMMIIGMLAFSGCKTPEPEPVAAAPDPSGPATTVEQRSAESQPTEPAPTQAAPSKSGGFVPVQLRATPHEEEGATVDLSWAAPTGDVELYGSAGVVSKATAKVKLKQGEKLKFDESVVVVTEGFRITPANDSAVLTGAFAVKPMTGEIAMEATELKVGKDDAVYVLLYAGEGTCYMQVNQKTYIANCPYDEFTPKEVTKPKSREWWVLIDTEDDSGWLLVDERVDVELGSVF